MNLLLLQSRKIPKEGRRHLQKKKITIPILPLDSPAMGTRSKTLHPSSPGLSTRSKRRLSL
jgi:hypothetical protein